MKLFIGGFKFHLPTLFLYSISAILCGCSAKVNYLDDDYPGLIPKKYAPEILNLSGKYHQNLTMSPDGNEHLTTQTDSAMWRYERILRFRNVGADRIVLDTPQFVKDFQYQNFWFIGEPMISPNNRDLYFVADYPPDFWHSTRTASGDWSEPKKLDSVSSQGRDWFVSVSNNNTLYFAQSFVEDPDDPSLEMNGRIFKSPLIDGRYDTKEKVKGPFNEADAGDPVISPNEDYMVFGSMREGGMGKTDLYVAFRDEHGDWSDAYSLGDKINTVHWESGPFISPDEQFLFFTRRDSSGVNARFSDIYWVSMEVLEQVRKDRLQN